MWHWPQWVMVAYLAIELVSQLRVAARISDWSRGDAILYALITIAVAAGLVATLSAGGFW